MSAILQEVQALALDLELEPVAAHPAPTVQRTANVLAMPAAPMSGPMGNAIAFLQAGGTIEQMRDILALQREFEAGEARKAFVVAMARFKQNPPEILKDKRVYFESTKGVTDYWHATLGNVAQAIIEGLAKVGISHSWNPVRKGDRVHVTCTLTHELGHSESIELDGPLDNSGLKNALQQAQSTITYLMRYTLLAITGLAVRDEILPDDDGRGAGAGLPPPVTAATPPAPAANTYPQADFDTNSKTWRGLVEAGRKSPAQIITMVQTKAPLSADQINTINSWKQA